ncbi:MAG: ATP-binding protein [Elusimicrobiota bacterium]|nr:MAG: ATP-binding protein [Elusimicrobiota bacterium]
MLGKEQYEIVRASSGPEALRRILEQEFALVLLDVLMPGMDGFETAELIRKRRQSRHTPIIFITATSSNENHVGQGYSLGAVDYIYKPIIPEILKAKVQVFAELYRKTLRLARSEEALRLELREREKADAARVESEEKYRKLFSRASDAIIVYDEDGATVLDANKAALDLYGYARSEFLALTASDLESGKSRGRKTGADASEGGARSFTGFHKTKNGRVFPVETTCASVAIKGRKLIMALTRDVTERQKAAEAELMQEREAMQRQLVATVSHELRTPIAAIRAANETLTMGEVDNPKIRGRFLKIIENQAARLGGLVEDLLLVAELESGKCKPVPSEIDLKEFCAELVPGIAVLAKKKSVTIKCDVPAGLVATVDRSHLTGIFQNLLDNAIKYNKKNGSVFVSARRAAGAIEISVRDTGIGIPADDLPLIFQQFRRAPSVRELQIKGTGLGLYIIKTMVDSNGGRIWAESAPDDDGTVFRFTLPEAKA